MTLRRLLLLAAAAALAPACGGGAGGGPLTFVAPETGGRRPAVSADGRHVAFEADAPRASAILSDVFLYDRLSGAMSLASPGADGGSTEPGLSQDAVVFESRASNLAGPVNAGRVNVFLRRAGQTAVVSLGFGGAAANGDSFSPSVSADGRFVAFDSRATNLVSGGATGGVTGVFVRDLLLGVTELVSVGPDGPANADSVRPSISADGRVVAFQSRATNLGTAPSTLAWNVFVRNRPLGFTALASPAFPEPLLAPPVSGDRDSQNPKVSADGRYVAFESRASNLLPAAMSSISHVYVRDTLTRTTVGVTASVPSGFTPFEANGDSRNASISDAGRFVAFESVATNLAPGVSTFSNVYVRDFVTGATLVASVGFFAGPANGDSFRPALSADGRIVAFESFATNLTNDRVGGAPHVFARDLFAARTERVSRGPTLP